MMTSMTIHNVTKDWILKGRPIFSSIKELSHDGQFFLAGSIQHNDLDITYISVSYPERIDSKELICG